MAQHDQGYGFGSPACDNTMLEQRCAALEARLRIAEAALAAIPSGLAMYDAQGVLQYANATLAQLTGLPPDTVRPGITRDALLQMSAACGEFGPPEEAARFVEELQQRFAALEADPSSPLSRVTRTRPNGEVLEVFTSATADGGTVVTLVDITARTKAEAVAGERAAILNAVISNARVGLTVFDAEHRVVAQNDMAIVMAGYPKDLKPVGRLHSDIVWDVARASGHIDDPTFRPVIDAALAADRTKPFLYTRPGFNGGWVDVYSDPMPDGGFTITHIDVTELRQAQDEKLRLAALHRTMIETMEQGVTIYDNSGRLLGYNPAALDMLCCTEADLPLGATMDEIIQIVLHKGGFGTGEQGEAEADVALQAAAAAVTDVARPTTSQRVNAAGQVLLVRRVPTPDGGHVVTYTDITRLAHAEQAERSRAELLQTTLDSVQHGIMVFTPTGELRLANRLALFGCALPAADGRTLSYGEMVREAHRQGVFGTGWAADSLAEYFFEMNHSVRHQEIIALAAGRQIELFCLPSADGGFVIAHTDVSELVTARDVAEAAAQEARALVQAIPGVLLRQRKNPDGTWTRFYVSDSVHDMTGYTVAEAERHGWWMNNVDPDDYPVLADRLDIAFGSGQSSAEFRFHCKNGEWIWVRAIMRGNVGADGLAEAICVWTDISRERELNDQVAHAKRLAQMGEVATAMAHEMNQPLASISLAAENALRALGHLPAPSAQLADKLRVITDQAHRAAALIDHIRVFSRSGQQRLGAVRLQDAAETAAQLLEGMLQACGTRLVIDFPPQFPEALARFGALEQALMNLIRNACEAYDRRVDPLPLAARVIYVEGWAEAATVHVRVRDMAGGIREDVLPRVFEPFFTTKPVGQGTGLGLSMTYGIITDLGGRVAAHNAGGGAVFDIELPRATIPLTPDAAQPAPRFQV